MPFKVTHIDFKKEYDIKIDPLWYVGFDCSTKDNSVNTYVDKWYALELYLGNRAIHVYWYKDKLE